ncbi:MAG: hypothetical protein J6B92_08235 [Paraprevotella sp.]|nr:hypothetical protein [Paraprevotella sp.]
MCKTTDKIQNLRYCTLFLVVLSIFTVALCVYLFYAHNVSLKTQQQIKESYKTHLQKADSLYCSLSTYNKNATLAHQNVNNAILADSIIKEALKSTNQLSDAQVESIKLIISTHFHNIELLHKKYGEKLSMDSLRLCTERELLEGQTKAMIDLHLDKIEHEYSNITMWGAILTILFLVFSFYSLYKIDELIKQGQEGVVKIDKIKTHGETIVSQFETDKQSIIKNTQEQLLGITEKYKETSELRQKEFDQLIVNVQQILAELEKKKNKKNSKKQE